MFMANVDTAIVNVATPAIHDSLGASGAELQLIVSSYIVSYAMLLIVGARLGGMFGYGRVFIAGVAVFTVASLACGLAPDALILIGARIVQGVGGALMVAQVLSGIQLTFSGQERVRAIGSYAVALSAGAVAGQILGGVIIAADLFGSSWRPAFLMNVPIGLVLMAAAARVLPMKHEARTRALDLRGVALLAVAVLLAIVPLILGREQHWPAWTWLSLTLSVPAFAAFVAVERAVKASGRQPLVNLEVLAQPRIAWGLAATGASIATYFSMLFVLALYLQQGLGKSALYSGLVLVSWVAAFGISGPLLGRLSAQWIPVVAGIGYLILAVSYFAISASLLAGQEWNGVLLVALLGLGGLGLGLGRNSSVADMTSSVPDHFAADASGLINTDTQLLGAAGVALFGTLYLSLAPQGGVEQALPAFTIVSAAFGLTALLAAAAAYPSIGGRTESAPAADPA
jgi:MFS family permease